MKWPADAKLKAEVSPEVVLLKGTVQGLKGLGFRGLGFRGLGFRGLALFLKSPCPRGYSGYMTI